MTHCMKRTRLWVVLGLCLMILGSALPGRVLAQVEEPANDEALLPFQYVRIWDKPC